MYSYRRNNKIKWLLIGGGIIVVLIFIALGIFFFQGHNKDDNGTEEISTINTTLIGDPIVDPENTDLKKRELK